MELEKLVMAELESMDLNGIKVIDLSCDVEVTTISFESDDQKIDFIVQSEDTLQVTKLTQDGQIYTDEESLNQSNEWFKDVEYVWDVVHPIIEKYQSERSEPAEIISTEGSEGCTCKACSQNQYEELFKMIDQMKQEIEELKRLEQARSELGYPRSVSQPAAATRKEKIFSIVGNVTFYFILVTIVLGVALFGLQEPGAAPRRLFGHSVMIVLSGSMEPTIPQRSLVVLREVDANILEVDDIVTYLNPNNTTITHRITEIIENYQGRGMRGFRLQGDNNLQEDIEIIWAENVIGEIIYINLFLGQVVLFIQEYIVLIIIFIVLFVALIFVIKKFFLNQENPPPILAAGDSGLGDEMVQKEVEDGKKKCRIAKGHLMLVTIVVIAGVFFYSIYRVVMIGRTYHATVTMSTNLRENYTLILPTLEEEGDGREFLSIDWGRLHERNEDIVAWVHAPGTNINYPILAGETNEEYLSLDIDRQHSIAGSIFLEENNESTFRDLNTIIYGHNMANGSKFSDIDAFVIGELTVEYAPYIYLYLPDGTVNIYKIVGAKLTDIYSEIYHLPVTDLEAFYELILEGNVLNVSFDKEEQLRVLTLSTCAELGVNSPMRSVVFALLIEEVSRSE